MEIKEKKIAYAFFHGCRVDFKYKDEDEAIERSGFDYNPDEEWAIETYEKGLVPENCHYAEVTCEDEEEDDE